MKIVETTVNIHRQLKYLANETNENDRKLRCISVLKLRPCAMKNSAYYMRKMRERQKELGLVQVQLGRFWIKKERSQELRLRVEAFIAKEIAALDKTQ